MSAHHVQLTNFVYDLHLMLGKTQLIWEAKTQSSLKDTLIERKKIVTIHDLILHMYSPALSLEEAS